MRAASWLVGLSLAATIVFFAIAPARAAPVFPRYDHVFLIVEENHSFSEIIGNADAPNLNALATTYGLATNYFSTSDPSEPNYIAMLGGSAFGVADDNAYYLHILDQPNLLSQIDAAGLSWKGYLQSLPYPGYLGVCHPGRCDGVPDFGALYGAKHNGIMYFEHNLATLAERQKMQPITYLARDLATAPPNFGYIVPDHCTDMHGSPPWCGDGGHFGDPLDRALVTRADSYAAGLVGMITGAPFWPLGNNAIVITFDEGNGAQGCCGSAGTGRVYTVVITSHGPRGVRDATPYNHYALLQTLEKTFGLPCLQHACDALVVPMAPLFAPAP